MNEAKKNSKGTKHIIAMYLFDKYSQIRNDSLITRKTPAVTHCCSMQ